MKSRKIIEVTVRHDDGTKRTFRNARDAEAYLAAMRLKWDMRALAAADLDWPAIAKRAEQRHAHMLNVRQTKRANASGPRNPVTKPQLIAFKDQYEKDEGTAHGWKAAACRKFKITTKTLDERMAE